MHTHHCLLPLALVAVVTACSRSEDRTTHASGGTTTVAPKLDSKDTAMSQSNAKADLDHLAEIRKALVGDDALSVAAKNVQIMTKDGHVSLRGKVANAIERDSVEAHARACPATRSIDDQIAVDAP